ncbi:MAG: thermonuclease family protein [Candidatus Aenigmarchaeota archaeon]|nr:thermonuclease family protein [Candidatus Aenigmarchaeota archaeon]
MKSNTIYVIILATFFISVLLLSTVSEAIHFKCKGKARCLTGIITKVIDGDTVVLNKTINIRLSLVDAPEKRDKVGWKKATDFTTKLCLNSVAIFDEDDKQRKGSYKRIVGVVYCGETNVNAALLDAGLAKGLSSFCKKSEFATENWASTICQIKKKK